MSNEFELVGTQILQNGEPFTLKAIVRMLNNKTKLHGEVLRKLSDAQKQNKKLIEENAVLHKEMAKDKRRLEAYDNME